MRVGSLILLGAVVFVLGLFLRSDLVGWTVNLLAFSAMVVGAMVFGAGVFYAVKSRQ